MKNIAVMGYLYRVSDSKFKRFLEATASDDPDVRNSAGELLGECDGRIFQGTDMTQDEAKTLLSLLDVMGDEKEMTEKVTDLMPQQMANELLRLAKIERHWIELRPVPDDKDGFICRSKHESRFLDYTWTNGAQVLGQHGMSMWLLDGPKIFRPTLEQCRVMEAVEVKLTLADYAQPYPAILIDLPEGAYPLFKSCLICYEPHYAMMTANIFSEGHENDVLSAMKSDERLLEDDISHFFEDAAHLAGPAQKVYRVAANCCLALVNFGHRRELLFKKQVESDRRLAGEQSERGKRARERIKQAISVVSFSQEVQLYRTSKHSTPGEPTGGEVKAHFRGGHWRMQPHGPRNSLRRRQFIKPMLIRPDKFIGDLSNTSTTYKGTS